MNRDNEALNHNNEALNHNNGLISSILDTTVISLCNHFTEHNNREPGWHSDKIFLCTEKSISQKNFYIDLYLSLPQAPLWIKCSNIEGLLVLAVKFNIRVYKNSYLSITLSTLFFALLGYTMILTNIVSK